MSGTLALASALAAMDRGALSALVARRPPQSPAGVSDPIGLATELLRPDAVARTLAALDRGALAALLRLDAGRAAPGGDDAVIRELTRLGLVGLEEGEPAALPEVTDALRAALETAALSADALQAAPASRGGAPGTRGDAPPADASPSGPAPDTSSWYTAAVTAVGQAAEILRVLRERPGRLNRNGTIAVATVRGLAESAGLTPDQAALALRALERAGLLRAAQSSQAVLPAASARDWLERTQPERWLALAEATLRAMPSPLAVSLAESAGDLASAVSSLPRRFPLLPAQDRAAAGAFSGAAEHLGLAVDGRLAAPAALLLGGDAAGARRAAEREIPAPPAGVYVQPDLSVVIPGPLAPDAEAALAALSRPEHIGVASTRRITEAALADAFERGTTQEQARGAFERLSLTGIPQPLEYLLGSLAQRAGSIRVGEHHGDEGRARITVSRPDLAETLRVDRALQHLQLQPGAGGLELFSRLRPDHVLAALGDARYPATAEPPMQARAGDRAADASLGPGITVDPPSEGTADPGGPGAPALPPELADLVDRVYRAARSEPGTGGFTRLLELAIRDRNPVRVTAEARGETRIFTLVPVSLSGGRLRATDQAAGVERTLPVNMVTAVEPL